MVKCEWCGKKFHQQGYYPHRKSCKMRPNSVTTENASRYTASVIKEAKLVGKKEFPRLVVDGRDPKIDPMPGDILWRNGATILVTEVKYPDEVRSVASVPITLGMWRTWVSETEVIHRGK